jgi:hypothetical protein
MSMTSPSVIYTNVCVTTAFLRLQPRKSITQLVTKCVDHKPSRQDDYLTELSVQEAVESPLPWLNARPELLEVLKAELAKDHKKKGKTA